ncbi:hypothetical protein MPSEU_000624600 [Mayamaea pseudoterrestris]|nr:hypothetical protein MPSEU_000624600 [Mayamaea pseudoterrestris]
MKIPCLLLLLNLHGSVSSNLNLPRFLQSEGGTKDKVISDAPSDTPSASPTAFCVPTYSACSNATDADPCCGENNGCLFDGNDGEGFVCRPYCTPRYDTCSAGTNCCGSMVCMEGVCDYEPVCVRPGDNCTSDVDASALPCCWRQECIEGTCQAPLTCRKRNETCGLEGQLDCCDGKICIQGRCEVETRCRRLDTWCDATAASNSSLACCNNLVCDDSGDVPTCTTRAQLAQQNTTAAEDEEATAQQNATAVDEEEATAQQNTTADEGEKVTVDEETVAESDKNTTSNKKVEGEE